MKLAAQDSMLIVKNTLIAASMGRFQGSKTERNSHNETDLDHTRLVPYLWEVEAGTTCISNDSTHKKPLIREPSTR